ncbi:MAG: DivIVA domain-containing protein [Ilumatobacteraceae bacterium]
MAITFSRPDPSEPSAVSAATFTPSRRGFDQAEVRDFLRMVAAEMARLRERERFLEHELRVAQSSNPNPAVVVDDELVTKMLGEEAARILQTAREAASQIKIRAEEQAARLVREASEDSTRVRDDAEQEALRRRDDAAADAEAEVQMAKQQGREMVEEARAYRERVLADLAQRRELARQQIEQIVHGRDRLVQAFERARLAAVDVIAELSSVGEPGEYVNLSPTTGPVPLMLPNTPRPVAERAPVVEPPVETPAVETPAVEPTPVADEPVADETVSDETVEQTTEVAAGASGIYDVELEDDLDDTPAHESPADVVAATDLEVEPEPEIDADVEHVDAEHVDVEHDDVEHDDRPIAPVVSLFGGETAGHPSMQTPPPPSAPKQSVDDLFARLKAARTDTVAEQTSVTERHVERPAPPSVFDASPPKPDTAPVATTNREDVDPAAESPFARRDRALEPLLVAATRKMKRTLADEQNDALAVLRRRQPVIGLDALVPKATDHAARFADAVDAELTAASLAGGSSVDDRGEAAHERAITDARALHSAIEMINDTIVAPLRERLGRAIADAEGDNGVIADHVRAIYREWKTQRIDGQLDEVLRLAFGCGALAAAVPGTPLCWTVDPNGPECPDAEDNALAGRVGAGDPFPTDHLCAPAHAGCRCMLVRAD